MGLLSSNALSAFISATLTLKWYQFELPRAFQRGEPSLLNKLRSIGLEEFRTPFGDLLLARNRIPKNTLSQMYWMGPVGFTVPYRSG